MPCSIKFIKEDNTGNPDVVQLYPSAIQLRPNTSEYVVNVVGKAAGHILITGRSVPSNTTPVANIFLRITVANANDLIAMATAVGWLYFVAWSVSFYPQIYSNYCRTSVVGLNFDFLSLNAVGFALYALYNVAMFWSENIGSEYAHRYPLGSNPVLANDVVFSLHALFATLLTIGQCVRYESGAQRVSWHTWTFLGVIGLVVAALTALGSTAVIQWLDVLTYFSYIKLLITLIKYVPQAVMNYRRQSTMGWSIGNVLLDFAGGLLSVLQMMLNAYNYSEWMAKSFDLVIGCHTKCFVFRPLYPQMIGTQYLGIQRNSVWVCSRCCLMCSSWCSTIFCTGSYHSL